MLSSRWLVSILASVMVPVFSWPALGASVATAPKTSPSALPSATPDLANRLQSYFSNSRKQLGTLESWQQKLFDEEALPEYQRFMRGYRLSTNGSGAGAGSAPAIVADIDFENLRQFLRFYAPKSLKREKPPILALLKPQTHCSKCVSSVPEVKTLVAERLERRGFKIIWTSSAELGDAQLAGTELDAALSQLAFQKKAVGALLVSWQNAVGDVDVAHPDTRHYTIRTSLDIRDVSKSQGQLELTQNGSFERSAAKLLADAFTELGARIGDLEVSQSELKREELLVDVIGIKSFSQYQLLKNGLQDALKSGALEEQKVSRGRAIFALFSDATIQKIQQTLASAKIEGLRLGPATVEGNEIHLELLAAETPAAESKPVDKKEGDPEA